ncbi:hypothetical protein G5714_020966 [Onychostoma macrolepis]|uniref:non-specific serine/threonine protein kinase n=1 Tax=Onychostoma macrolepis TaxID=369639 RepID=A0A7J6BVB7_9TELE|nr:hypothetical protein G5714_020966 [Onychostoma macrolepis]
MTSPKLQSVPCPAVLMTSPKLQSVPCPAVLMTSPKLQRPPKLQSVPCLSVLKTSSKLQSVTSPAVLKTSPKLQSVTCPAVLMTSPKLQSVTCPSVLLTSPKLQSVTRPSVLMTSPKLQSVPCVEEIIQLLDWWLESDHYILVVERPMLCEELNWFLLRQIVTIEEDVTHAQTCCRRGVWRRGVDIKMENILINSDTLEVKLIDFGCGDFLSDAAYMSLAECCNIICRCLQLDPKQRIELENLSLHDWFTV